MELSASENQAKAEKIGVRRGLAVGGALLFMFIGCNRIGSGAAPAVAHGPHELTLSEKSDARIMSEKFVRQQLKAPGTASFPGFLDDDILIQPHGKGILVSSWVDSQNSFGAKIRTRYICTLHQTGEDTWQLDKLAFDE